MWTSKFWKKLIERMLTGAATAISAAQGLDVVHDVPLDLWHFINIGGYGALTAAVTCFATRSAGDPNSGSFTGSHEDWD